MVAIHIGWSNAIICLGAAANFQSISRRRTDTWHKPIELRGIRFYHGGMFIREHAMNPFSKTNLPITLVLALIVWAWLSLFSGLIAAL
jgi:hypothetical protein